MEYTVKSKKLRITKILEYLREHSDVEHPVDRKQIEAALAASGITTDRRTFAADIKLLNESGYEVFSERRGKSLYYWVSDEKIEKAELAIILDALRAASFIPAEKTEKLVDKLIALNGNANAAELKNSAVCWDVRKHTNQEVYYVVDHISTAIKNGHAISFLYFDLDENGRHVYRKNRERYVQEPLSLIYHEDNYYLVCYTAKHDGLNSYRVDRMEDVIEEDAAVSQRALSFLPEVQHFTEQVFKMFGGKETTVKLRFDFKTMQTVYDKFGEGITIKKVGEDLYETEHLVQISPVFFGWLFQFGDKIEIIEPGELKNEYQSYIDDVKR